MPRVIDKTEATDLLCRILSECQKAPVSGCPMKTAIDFLFNSKKTLTYCYILFTALTAKAVDPNVDIMSLQAVESAPNAYDARSFCSRVIFPFQKNFLGDVIDGSNADPLVNNPGRNARIDINNPAQGGNPKRALEYLCEGLPAIDTSEKARECLSYLITVLLKKKDLAQAEESALSEAVKNSDVLSVWNLIDQLLNQGFGGASLVLAASAMYRVLYPEAGGYSVLPHPVNQSGASSRQFSDLDVMDSGRPFIATELKDKPFNKNDIDHAVKTALRAEVSRLLFIAGRQSAFEGQTKSYFDSERRKWIGQGINIGVMSIDALVDFVFATKEICAPDIYKWLREDAKAIKHVEAHQWILAQALKNES